MASYKDPANLKFNPYVRTLPVEAMAKVGQYKQERYDQGVQKIQQSIDNIAGLEIAKPEDKEYLQSKLNALGSQLTNVAGGDFSNFALVNSVNGMTNQIAKDPGVINAVSNTAKYKKDIAAKEKLELEGKWAPSNEAAFQKDVNKWYSNPSIDAKYNANVSPFVDVTKDSVAIIKALASKVVTSEVSVEQDSKGNYIIYDAITRRKVEGISKERIATALKTGLSPQAYRQLAIDGQYKYSGTSADKYISDINATYQKDFLSLTTRREELTNSLSSLSPAEQTRANKRIEDIDRAAVQLKQEYDSISSGFESGDVEGSQAQYYTMNFLENTSNAYASQTQSTTFHTNPFKTQENFERNMQQTQDNWDKMYAVKIKEYNLKVEQERRDQAGIFGELTLPTDAANNLTDSEVMQESLVQTNAASERVDSLMQDMINLNITAAEFKKPSIVADTNKKALIQQYKKAKKLRDRLLLKDEKINQMAAKVNPVPSAEETIANLPNTSKFIDDTGGYQYIEIGNKQINVDDLSKMLRKFTRLYPINARSLSPTSGLSGVNDEVIGKEKTWATERAKAKKELSGIELLVFENMFEVPKEKVGGMFSQEFKQPDIELGEQGYSSIDNSTTLSRNTFDTFITGAKQINEQIKIQTDKQDDWKEQQYVNQRNVNLVKTSSIDKDNFKDVTTTLGNLIQLANSAGGMLATELQEGDIGSAAEIAALLEDGIKNASVYTDQTGNQQGLIVNDKRIPIPSDQFDEITKRRFEPSPQRKYYQNEVMPLLLSTLPELMQVNKKDDKGNNVMDEYGNPIKESVTKDRGYYTTSIDGEYIVTTFNSQYSTSAGSFPQLKGSYDIHLNFNTIQEPQDTNYVVAQILVNDPLDETPKTLNLTMTPEKISEFFNLLDSNGRPALEQLIYGTLNRAAIDRGEMAKNINDEKGYKLLLKNQSEKLDN